MTVAAPLIENPIVSAALVPPAWMAKAEKAAFDRIVIARKAAGNPLLSAEFDLLCDYISSRTRINALRRFLKREIAGAGDYAPSHRHVAALIRQVDTSTSLSRRLARELKL